MNEDNKRIPEFKTYEELADFWDTHSLSDYWEQTESAEFEISPQARHRYVVPLDRDLLVRVQKFARQRGLSIESIVNLLIEQREKLKFQCQRHNDKDLKPSVYEKIPSLG
jgi:DNA-binding transcriptional MerR regulator